MNRLAYMQIALCVVVAVASAGIATALTTHTVCVPSADNFKDCTQGDPGPGVMTCFARSGQVFMRWPDGHWLEVVPAHPSEPVQGAP